MSNVPPTKRKTVNDETPSSPPAIQHSQLRTYNLSPSYEDDIVDTFFLAPTTYVEQARPSRLDFSPLLHQGVTPITLKSTSNPYAELTSQYRNRGFVVTSNDDVSSSIANNDSDYRHEEGPFDIRPTEIARNLSHALLASNTTKDLKVTTLQPYEHAVNVKEANGTVTSIIDWAKKSRLDEQQMRAFEILASSFVLTFFDDVFSQGHHESFLPSIIIEYKKLQSLSQRSQHDTNLIAFLHGPAGSGKTTIIHLLIHYCDDFCRKINYPFTERTLVVTAFTGIAAATLLQVDSHNAIFMPQRLLFDSSHLQDWSRTRLLIIEDISSATPALLAKIDTKLKAATNTPNCPYGGLNILFTGDLCNLGPFRGQSISTQYCPQFDDCVNCYIELDGKHRFHNDPIWADILSRFRIGQPTANDIRNINARLCNNIDTLPPNIRHVTPYSRTKDALNTAAFLRYCSSANDNPADMAESALIVLSDNLQVKRHTGFFRRVTSPHNFWQTCRESDIRVLSLMRGRVDPVLKLFHKCPITLTTNFDITSGKANGTTAWVDHVALKSGERTFPVSVGAFFVPAVFASQVDYIQLQEDNNNVRPRLFRMQPIQRLVRAYIRDLRNDGPHARADSSVVLKMTQLPISTSTATTAPRLQHSPVSTLYVHKWSYAHAWVYTVLSRVNTISALHLGAALSNDLSKYTTSPVLMGKLHSFRNTKVRRLPSTKEYKWMNSNSSSPYIP